MTETTGSLSDEQTCSASSTSDEGGIRKTGKCKWFNVAKGWGFITPDDPMLSEVFVHQSVIHMNGFRSLGDDERVEFEFRESDKGIEATFVTGPEGGECSGSHRRPSNKKKVKKIRCYNCGDLAHHIASKCNLGPQPKRCHNCKAENHLIADCPKRQISIDQSSDSPDPNGKQNNNNKTNSGDTSSNEGTDSSVDVNLNDLNVSGGGSTS